MDDDTLKMAGLVSRKVDTVDRDGKPAKRAIAGRTYPTSINDLWDAVTNIERIPRWFLPVTGDLVDPKEVEAWQASEEGLAFIAEASAGWAEASIADGTDPKAARDAGQRVTAFYTGSDG